MNLRDSKEPQVSGQATSRQEKQTVLFVSPKGNKIFDVYNMYDANIVFSGGGRNSGRTHFINQILKCFNIEL